MLTRENNELICRVGADTPMGKALRRYWIPVCNHPIYRSRTAIPSLWKSWAINS